MSRQGGIIGDEMNGGSSHARIYADMGYSRTGKISEFRTSIF